MDFGNLIIGILEKDATHNLQPPSNLWSQLDEQETENVKKFQREVDVSFWFL
jgi:hypothetical protein